MTKSSGYYRPPNFDTATVRLFCLPYAGGGTWIFRDWIRALAPDVAICAVNLPVRGDRFREPPVTNLRKLARAVTEATASSVSFAEFEGGHFFIHDAGPAVCAHVLGTLLRAAQNGDD